MGLAGDCGIEGDVDLGTAEGAHLTLSDLEEEVRLFVGVEL